MNTNKHYINDIFISYSHVNKDVVHKIADLLEKNKIKLWIDKTEIGTSDKQIEEMANGLNGSKIALCFLSVDYYKSFYCKREIKYAFKLESKMEIRPIYVTLEAEALTPMPPWVEFIVGDDNLFYAHKPPLVFNPWSQQRFDELLNSIKNILSEYGPTDEIPSAKMESVIVPSVDPKDIEELTKNNYTHDVFISYSNAKELPSPYSNSNEKEIVYSIYQELTKRGFHLWLDQADLNPWENIMETIAKAIKIAKVGIIFVTKKYVTSRHCRMELEYMCKHQVPVVYVLLEDISKIPDELFKFLIQRQDCLFAYKEPRNFVRMFEAMCDELVQMVNPRLVKL